MRKAVYQLLLDGLAGLSAPEAEKRQFEELIRQSAALDGIVSIDRPERVKFARQLLSTAGAARPEIRNRLMARFDIGESQAYRDINDALKIVPISAGFWDSTQV